ncbi:hypothetical protein [Flagellimonas meishanensis]|uniref:hypothetical protein n=1 Tax=Flagellimonas meishanensis TaxID=2873264 RepID=UPI001CA7ACE4|nr:hypothetical protein [[Muricauda] meishanensis]
MEARWAKDKSMVDNEFIKHFVRPFEGLQNQLVDYSRFKKVDKNEQKPLIVIDYYIAYPGKKDEFVSFYINKMHGAKVNMRINF